MSVYVCSDLHGLKDRFDAILAFLKKEDTLYVLGDVIDRGKDGIAILQEIRKNEQVHLLLGNHEFMMKQNYEAEQGKFDQYEASTLKSRWKQNHCSATKWTFEHLPEVEQQAILQYLDTLQVAITNLEVNGQVYYLVHGCPQPIKKEGSLTQEDIVAQEEEIESYVWNRIEFPGDFFSDRCVIVGHTPTLYYQNEHPYQIWTNKKPLKETDFIDIDCGCAANNADTQAALLRLDDRSIFYF